MWPKSGPLYSLDIRNIYPRIEGFDLSSPIVKVLFNTAFLGVRTITSISNSVRGDTATLPSS